MTTGEIMKSALIAGDQDDATVAATLDGFREYGGLSLLDAVLEVSRIVHETRCRRALVECATNYAKSARFRQRVRAALVGFDYRLEDLPFTLYFTTGFNPPRTTAPGVGNPYTVHAALSVSVGASWILARLTERMCDPKHTPPTFEFEHEGRLPRREFACPVPEEDYQEEEG